MKAPQFYITLALGALCLVLSITTIGLGTRNSNLQVQNQQQQEIINKGKLSAQILQSFLNDMGELSLKNEKIKQVLTKNNLSYVPASAKPAPSATPKPSPVQ